MLCRDLIHGNSPTNHVSDNAYPGAEIVPLRTSDDKPVQAAQRSRIRPPSAGGIPPFLSDTPEAFHEARYQRGRRLIVPTAARILPHSSTVMRSSSLILRGRHPSMLPLPRRQRAKSHAMPNAAHTTPSARDGKLFVMAFADAQAMRDALTCWISVAQGNMSFESAQLHHQSQEPPSLVCARFEQTQPAPLSSPSEPRWTRPDIPMSCAKSADQEEAGGRHERCRSRVLRWIIGVWQSDPTFWRVFPWVFSVTFLLCASFMALYIAQSYFQDDDVFVVAWIETMVIGLLQAWLLQDVLVIVLRNNIPTGTGKKLFAKYGRSKWYQMIEKFLIAPLGLLWSFLRSNLYE